MPSFAQRLRPLLALSALAALAGCREEAVEVAAPLPATSEAYYAYGLAPAAEALPYAAPVPIGRTLAYDDGYAWAERAYAIDTAFYDAPPDYGFNYYDTQPWVWETEDDWLLYAEPLEVGYRYYYYAPDADYPYFIRDPDYGYGFDDYGRLVTLYDVSGVLLPSHYLYERADIAGRYRARAYGLHEAAGRERRRKIRDDVWLSREPDFRQSRAKWFHAARNEPQWVNYRTRYDGRELRRFDDERRRRGKDLERFDRREAGLQRGDDGRRWAADDGRAFGEHSDFDRDHARSNEPRRRDLRDEPRGRREDSRGRDPQLTYANLERRDQGEFERRRAERRERERGWRDEGQMRERQAQAESERRQDAQREANRQERERRWRDEGHARERQARAESERRQDAQQEARRQERERRWRDEGHARERQARAESERRQGAQQEARRQEHERRWRDEGQARERHARAQAERQGGGHQEARRQERERGGGDQAQAQPHDHGGDRRAEREARRESRGGGRGGRDG